MELVDRLGGSVTKKLTLAERDQNYHQEFRKGLYFSREMAEGERIQTEDFVSLRPAATVSPSQYETYVGRSLARGVKRLDGVRPEDFL